MAFYEVNGGEEARQNAVEAEWWKGVGTVKRVFTTLIY